MLDSRQMQRCFNLLGNLLRCVSRSVYDQFRFAIVRQAAGVESAKRFDVACQGAWILRGPFAGSPAAPQEFIDVKLQKNNVCAAAAQEVGILRLGKGPAAERNDGRSGGLLQHRPQSISLNPAKVRFTVARKQFVDAQLRPALDFAIEVNEAPAE